MNDDFDPHALDDEMAQIDCGADVAGWTPAFPEYAEPNAAVTSGMSLRDYFAAHEPIDPNDSIGVALAERLTGRPYPKPEVNKAADVLEMALFWADAEAAYRYLRADAMLRARAS